MSAVASSRAVFGCRERGFTLVEMTTSVAVLVVVLTAAWLLLSVSNNNLNRIEGGGQASEMNRAALASFERDLNHSMLVSNVSPVERAYERTCSFRADVNADDEADLVTWTADDQKHELLRVVTSGGVTATDTVLTGLAPASELQGEAMFIYAVDATHPDWEHDPGKIGLITLRLRNGMPDAFTNVVDRTAAFRVIAYVINGY